jgi:hypothetical protein
MKVSIAMIEMTRSTPAARAYWWIALGVLDAMAAGGLPDEMQAKPSASPCVSARRSRNSSRAGRGKRTGCCARRCTWPPAPPRAASPWPWCAPPTAWKAWCPPRRLRKPSACCPSCAACANCWPPPRTTGTGFAPAPPLRCRPSTNARRKSPRKARPPDRPTITRLTAAILEQPTSCGAIRRGTTKPWRWKWQRHCCLPNRRWRISSRSTPISPDSTDAVVERLAASAAAKNSACWTAASRRDVAPGPGATAAGIRGARNPRQPRCHRDHARRLLPRHLAPWHWRAAAADPPDPGRAAGAGPGSRQCRACRMRAAPSNASPQPGFTPQAGDFEDVAKKLSALGFFVTQLQAARPTSTPSSTPPPLPSAVHEEVEPVMPVAAEAAPAPEPPEHLHCAAGTPAPTLELAVPIEEPAAARNPSSSRRSRRRGAARLRSGRFRAPEAPPEPPPHLRRASKLRPRRQKPCA